MLFSIITICKDNLEELQATYSSLSAQKNVDVEWIVIDGGSSDGTKSWLENNSAAASWISEPDNGIYDAMNKGTALSTGLYLIFMNSGDEFENASVLSRVKEILDQKEDKPAFVYGDSVDVDENNNQHYRQSKKHSLIKYGMITQHQAMFFNRLKIPNLTYSEELSLSADYGLIAAVIKANDPKDILQLDFPICKFKMGGLNEMRRFKAIKEDFKIRKDVLRLSWMESSFLYFLHFSHAVVKQTFKKSRFLRHKNVSG